MSVEFSVDVESAPCGVLSLARMGAGAEGYYLGTVADGLEEYYTGAGESPGVWVGSACADLGLAGEVEAADLSAVLAGRSPVDGSELGCNRQPANRRVAGFDLTFSAPKSVSVLYGLGSDTVSREVRAAHHEALTEALAYLEAHAAWARRGHDGVHVLPTSGLVAAGYTHRTSRNGDPQLHTHVLVANVVHGADGRWSALSSKPLHHQVRTAGFVYQAVLRASLRDRLGVSFSPVVKGAAEIAGVPKSVLSEFSSRRHEILARLDEIGGSSRRAREIAVLDTRKGKEMGADALGLRERWLAQGAEVGFGGDQVEQLLGPPGRRQLTGEDARSLRDRLVGREGLTASSSTFERRDVVRAVCESLPEGARLHEIEGFAEWFVNDKEVVTLGHESRAGERLRTTREILELEERILSAGSEMRRRWDVVPDEIVESVLAERPELSEEQAEMVRRLTTSGKALQVVIGKPGTGKTYALDAARAAFQRAGFRVQGTALAARAAAELEAGAGIASCTLARFLDINNLCSLGSKDVVVLDEAGMVGTRQLAELVRFATRRNWTLVLVGDHRQLPEIEAGGALAALAKRIGVIELSENRRQSEAWEREALDHLREGRVAPAVVAFDEHERIHLGDSAAATREAMARDFVASYREGAEARMYALRRSDVKELNALARDELRRAGELGDDVLAVAGRGFAEGDEVLFCRNDRRIGVLNGTRGTVTGLSECGGLLVDTSAGERIAPLEYLEEGHLAHGYASTVHKAQGATVDRAFVLGSDAIYQEAGYVAMSRARERTDLYVVTSAFDVAPEQTLGNEALIAALASSRAKELATEALAGSPPSEPAMRQDPDAPWAPRVMDAAGLPATATALDHAARRFEERGPDRARDEARTAVITEALLGDALANGPHAHLAEHIGPRPDIPGERSRWSRLAGALQARLQRGEGRERDDETGRKRGDEMREDDPFAWLERTGVLEPERDRGYGLGR